MRFLLVATAITCGVLGFAQHAGATIAIIESAEIDSTVTALGGGQFLYSYSVYNDRGCTSVGCNISPFNSLQSSLTNLYLPFFPDANVADIVSPPGWTASILSTDLFGLGSGAETLEWSGTLAALDTLGGFSYVATFAPVTAPFQEDFSSGAVTTVDPPIPGSPDATSAGLTQQLPVSSTPEPSFTLLGSVGLFCLVAAARRIRA